MIDILLVEDDKEICFILTELLKRNPYNVSAYHNGHHHLISERGQH